MDGQDTNQTRWARPGHTPSYYSLIYGNQPQGSYQTQLPGGLPFVPSSPFSPVVAFPPVHYQPVPIAPIAPIGHGCPRPAPATVPGHGTTTANLPTANHIGHLNPNFNVTMMPSTEAGKVNTPNGHEDYALTGTNPAPVIDVVQDDLLTNPLPPPSTGRRGRDHIDDVIQEIERINQQPTPPLNHAVPWYRELQPQGTTVRSVSEGRFQPMRTIHERDLEQRRLMSEGQTQSKHPSSNSFRQLLCSLNGFSSNYMGDISNKANRSADIPEELNCSLWVVGLFAGMTVPRLLGSIAKVGPTGKIFATVISNAQPEKGHSGAAAKIVFFDRTGAERLKAAIEGERLDGIIGRKVRVTFNRIQSAPQPLSDNSRVVIISGPKWLVNYPLLQQLFRDRVQYETEAVLVLEETVDRAVLEWRFGSFRAQAQAVCMYLSKEHQHVLTWKYGKDPCVM